LFAFYDDNASRFAAATGGNLGLEDDRKGGDCFRGHELTGRDWDTVRRKDIFGFVFEEVHCYDLPVNIFLNLRMPVWSGGRSCKIIELMYEVDTFFRRWIVGRNQIARNQNSPTDASHPFKAGTPAPFFIAFAKISV
jgi:hypothetical protein